MSAIQQLMLAQGASTGSGGDPYWSNVVSLLHFDGADGSTTFTDQTGNVWTPSGNAQIDTALAKFGGASGLFDGAGDTISAASTAGFGFGSGDYTLEAFVNAADTASRVNHIFDTRTGVNTGVAFFIGGGMYSVPVNTIGFSSNTAAVAYGGTVSANTWYHIALARQGTTIMGFVNGVVAFTSTDSRTYASASTCVVGGGYDGITDQYLNGHINEVRITKGVARYTANFTPPTAPFPDS